MSAGYSVLFLAFFGGLPAGFDGSFFGFFILQVFAALPLAEGPDSFADSSANLWQFSGPEDNQDNY